MSSFDFTINVTPPVPEYFPVREQEYNQVTGRMDDVTRNHLPNFGRLYTHRSVKSGRWSDPATWDRGEVPGPGATVIIDTGHEVEYDVMN